MKKLLSLFIVCVALLSLFTADVSAVREDYTGWAVSKPSGNRYYYENGSRLTGAHSFPDGKRYVFDDKGVYLFRRSPDSELEYEFDLNEDGGVSIERDIISFKIKVNPAEGKDLYYYNGDSFMLYAYKDGKWIFIPYKENVNINNSGHTAEMGKGYLHYALNLSKFDYDFKPGLYRVKTKIDTSFTTEREICFEFNLTGNSPLCEIEPSQVKHELIDYTATENLPNQATIASVKERDDFIAELGKIKDIINVSGAAYSIETELSGYDSEFFKDNIIYLYVAGAHSSSVSHNFKSLTQTENGLIINMIMESPFEINLDIRATVYFVRIDREYYSGGEINMNHIRQAEGYDRSRGMA